MLNSQVCHNNVVGDPLRQLIGQIVMADKDYELRNRLVIKAVGQALEQNLDAGFRLDDKEPEWPVAYIELPTGQVSWHLKQHKNPWDGHDDAAKWLRCARFIVAQSQVLSFTNLRVK